jgi:hypothetical protein
MKTDLRRATNPDRATAMKTDLRRATNSTSTATNPNLGSGEFDHQHESAPRHRASAVNPHRASAMKVWPAPGGESEPPSREVDHHITATNPNRASAPALWIRPVPRERDEFGQPQHHDPIRPNALNLNRASTLSPTGATSRQRGRSDPRQLVNLTHASPVNPIRASVVGPIRASR